LALGRPLPAREWFAIVVVSFLLTILYLIWEALT
jgi:hypothetical protein